MKRKDLTEPRHRPPASGGTLPAQKFRIISDEVFSGTAVSGANSFSRFYAAPALSEQPPEKP